MYLNSFIKQNNLKQTDAIVLKKRFLGLVDHYVLFMGYRGNQPVFVANYNDGVQEVPKSELDKYLKVLKPERIERFPGNESERKFAFKRAISRLGEKAYNYFGNNCGHFKNYVHIGENYSEQVDKVGNVGLIAGAGLGIAGIASKNPKVALWGAGLLLAGVIMKELANE
ncbi:MAG: hypothetical protein GXO80_01400 [Chlorobi bacterium]|nr:hypothetical protein [Chlorobiota bacterium]